MKTFILSFLFAASIALTAYAQTNIRRVDFNNFTYEPFCIGEETKKITVKSGEFFEEKEMDGFTDRFYFKASSAEYGDLTGDGQDEAVILTVCNTGGTGNFSEGFIYQMKNGKPVLLSRIEGGDRADGGLHEARIENGLLVVESNDPGAHGGACCPEFVVTSRYKLSGRKLVETGKSQKRELYPKQRISFPKGASGTMFKVTLRAGDLKRFVVGARAGQTLTASVSSNETSLRLLEDAALTEGINNFRARLPKNGDYTIEIQNNAETDLEITININIR
ncbi:MAG: hypothetical protein H0U50_13290 [Pyrinomonadaceae bacterium]|nr:hypothetical protein [Pyrinomonadaceae bacterium]